MSRLYIGTAGWSYPKGQGTWEGTFYPPKLADKDKLTFYSQYFNTVEINSSFYRPPNRYAAKAWAGKVPEDFRFTVKLWQKFTHPKITVLQENTEHHIEEEEGELFPKVRKIWDNEKRQEVGRLMEQMKQERMRGKRAA